MMNNLLTFASVAKKTTQLLSTVARLRLLLVMFLTLCVSAAWGAEETATFIASSYGWNDGAKTGDPTTKTVDDITFEFAGGSTKPTYYDANGLRTYEGCEITISSEATISSIAFTYTISNNGSLSATPGTWNSSTKKWSGSANTVTFTVGHSSGTKNGQIRITQIAVTYTPTVSCTDPTITTQPTGATYTKGAIATALKVVASGDDLTYQWYSNTSNSTSGATAINGATNTTYTPSTSTVGTKYYYCIVSSGSCSTTSNIVSVIVKNPPFTVTLVPGSGSVTSTTLTESSSGAGVTLPTPTLNGCDEWSFAGWKTSSAVTAETTTKPTLIPAGTYKPTANTTLYAVYQRTDTTEGTPTTTTTTDKLTRETTGVKSGSTTYTDWSDKTVTSKAVYAGNSAGSNNSIQLRSKNSNSGVITTKSGGKAKKVTVVWQSSTSSGRTLDIYGKNSAYSAATELYSTSTQGTKLGSIVKGTSTTLTITGDYEYIGLRSNSDAMYLTSISIDWATTTAGGTTTTTYYHSTPDCATQTLVSVIPKITFLGQAKFTHFLR